MTAAGTAARPTGLPVRALAAAILWLGVFSGGFVFYEPSPHELIFAALIPIWLLAGLPLPRAIAPLVGLSILFIAGGVLTLTQSPQLALADQPLFIAVTGFLCVTAWFYAAVVAEDPGWADVIAGAWIAAALATTALGVIGYFNLAPNELFTLYGRAAGGFKDPNVFGPFLVLPFVLLAQRIMTGQGTLARGAFALFILFGIFLSFSRAAWGLTVLTTLVMMLLLYANERSATRRAHYIALGMVGALVAAAGVAAALSIDEVGRLFAERAQIVQDYDAGRLGRFERHAIGFRLMLEHPLGIGYAEFGRMFGEDEHNVWLKALTTYGWLGFLGLFGMVAWTLIAAAPLLFRTARLQLLTQAVYVVFLGHVLVATVIDVDHWRHVFLLIGLLWGAIALDRRDRQRRLLRVAPGRRPIAARRTRAVPDTA